MINDEKKPIAWGWVIVCLLVFWPIGLVLLIVKLNVDKNAMLNSGKTAKIVAFIIMAIGVLGLIETFRRNPYMVDNIFAALIPTVIMLTLFGGGALWVYDIGKNAELASIRYKKYIEQIVNRGQTSLITISSFTNEPYDMVVRDLEHLIQVGYFKGAHIDTYRREIILAQSVPQPMPAPNVQPAYPIQERVVVCNSCGAHNRVIGQVGRCAYCDSHLQ